MAASIRPSPIGEAVTPCVRAKPATSALPTHENSQNAGRGRSPPRSTPKIAVASGSRPTKMMEWAVVTCFSARAVSKGKPTTTPSATITSDSRSPRSGRFCRNRSSSARPSIPAIAARADVRNVGSKSFTATRVAGSEPLKINTPMNPFTQPLAILSIICSVLSALYRAEPVALPETMRYSYTKLSWAIEQYGWTDRPQAKAAERWSKAS